MANKNQLAKNIRKESTLDDIQRDAKLENLDCEFEVEFEDAFEAEEAAKWNMTQGEHLLRAVSYDKIEEPTVGVGKDGNEFVITPHYAIGMEDVKTQEFDYLIIQIDPEAERKFKLAINTRSGRDLGRKITPHKVTELTVKSVAQYLAKYPCKFRYDLSHWVDENGEHQTSKNPKIQLWNPEDFNNRKHSNNFVSLRK